jgi:trans-2,3-dihydro-3-hydroxyanthranilate isomerase
MRAIAREFNQSETTFLLRPTLAGATCRLLSLTPTGVEVGGAGHNALGAWLWLEAAGRVPDHQRELAQQIAGAVLPVELIREPGRPVVVSMDQSPPQFGEPVTERAELATALGLDPDDLAASEPARVVSTGAAHLMVWVRDRAAVDRAAPDAQRLKAMLSDAGAEGCYLYSLDPVDTDGAVAYTRFFNPTVGIVEDPATGTAAGPLVALLVATGKAAGGAKAFVEQGHALGRPSRIEVTVTGERVRVSGSGLVVADGTLRI